MCKKATLLPTSEQTNTSDAGSYTDPYAYMLAESIQDIVEAFLVISKDQAAQVGLVSVMLHFDSEGKAGPQWGACVDQSIRYYLENLRRLVRKTDRVFLHGFTFHFLLPGANQQGASIVQERLWEALLWRVHSAHDGDVLRPCYMTIGHSAYPEPHKEVNLCIDTARIARQSFDVQPEKAGRQLAAQPAKDTDLPVMARKLGVPYLSLLPRQLPSSVKRLVSTQLAQELNCYPVGRERNILTVAMSNPQDNQALNRLQKETGLNIFPVLVHPQELQTVLEQLV